MRGELSFVIAVIYLILIVTWTHSVIIFLV